jgi:cell wall-associated NlpC family hydrolase
MSDLKPGDLVYYKNTAGRGITHAAIYVGNGMMVTANSPRQGVRLSSIYDSYWRSHWAGGLRVRG